MRIVDQLRDCRLGVVPTARVVLVEVRRRRREARSAVANTAGTGLHDTAEADLAVVEPAVRGAGRHGAEPRW